MTRDDPELRRWSYALLALAILSAVGAVVAPARLAFRDMPIALARGTEVWSTGLHGLPAIDVAVVLVVGLSPQIAWVIAVAQIVILAQRYVRGEVFRLDNTLCFLRLGGALVAMGILQVVAFVTLSFWLVHRHIAPWMPDIDVADLLHMDLVMAGAFFFVLGKIMHRGAQLQESDELTI